MYLLTLERSLSFLKWRQMTRLHPGRSPTAYFRHSLKENIHRPDQIRFLPNSRLPFLCTSTRHVPSFSSLLTWQLEVKPLVESTAFMSEVWRSWRPPWVADITWFTRDLHPFTFPVFKWSRLGCFRISQKCYKLASYLVSGLQSNLIWYATAYNWSEVLSTLSTP